MFTISGYEAGGTPIFILARFVAPVALKYPTNPEITPFVAQTRYKFDVVNP